MGGSEVLESVGFWGDMATWWGREMLVLAFLLCLTGCANVYASGSDHKYAAGDPVPLYANKVGPFHNPRWHSRTLDPHATSLECYCRQCCMSADSINLSGWRVSPIGFVEKMTCSDDVFDCYITMIVVAAENRKGIYLR